MGQQLKKIAKRQRLNNRAKRKKEAVKVAIAEKGAKKKTAAKK